MIFFLFIILILTIAIIFLSFDSTITLKSKRNTKKFKLILLITSSSMAALLYISLSNYWIGGSILEKIITQTNIKNRQANEIAIVREIMLNLEKDLIKFPNNIEIILELAETKFILGYLEQSLNLYKKAKGLSPDNIKIMKAEAKVRVLLENESLSNETLSLLNVILSIEPKNILALYILGNYEYEKKNFLKADKMFQVLKGLLNKGGKEYNEINNKIIEMEKVNEK